ncbi:MAG: DNA-directed RNA polymerase subunit omega [Clostridia bacterium]|nr:DNA-directed RNA polymerase subunit omega [Clostridia bacterium]
MEYPKIDELREKVGNKYGLVILASKRARDMIDATSDEFVETIKDCEERQRRLNEIKNVSSKREVKHHPLPALRLENEVDDFGQEKEVVVCEANTINPVIEAAYEIDEGIIGIK